MSHTTSERTAGERADALAALAEAFREHGFEGASLARITERTGLGKGSLYHFFPGGKDEMAAAVLAEIEAWFEEQVFRPLAGAGRTGERSQTADPLEAVRAMFGAVEAYFQSGRRVCLVGVFALADTRDRFAGPVRRYFTRWIDALAATLRRAGRRPPEARALAEDVVLGVQGALVLARALDDPAAFTRAVRRLRARLALA